MKQVVLDGYEEAVKRFVLSLAASPEGSLLEIGGRVVVCVDPVRPNGNAGEPWTDEKNARRSELIDREIAGGLTPAEAQELEQLQRAMLQHRRRVARCPWKTPAGYIRTSSPVPGRTRRSR
jgi:hypothetical protein